MTAEQFVCQLCGEVESVDDEGLGRIAAARSVGYRRVQARIHHGFAVGAVDVGVTDFDGILCEQDAADFLVRFSDLITRNTFDPGAVPGTETYLAVEPVEAEAVVEGGDPDADDELGVEADVGGGFAAVLDDEPLPAPDAAALAAYEDELLAGGAGAEEAPVAGDAPDGSPVAPDVSDVDVSRMGVVEAVEVEGEAETPPPIFLPS